MVDLSRTPDSRGIQLTYLLGARGRVRGDSGDMLAYSAAVAQLDGDRLVDMIINEMGGNGKAEGTTDAGNLVIISGKFLKGRRPDCSGVVGGTARLDVCGTCWGGTTGVAEGDACVSYRAAIQPMLDRECRQCHGTAGGLSVASYETLMAGDSDHGPVVNPGSAEASVLLQKLIGSARFGQAMPGDHTLASGEIELFRAWIQQGASRR